MLTANEALGITNSVLEFSKERVAFIFLENLNDREICLRKNKVLGTLSQEKSPMVSTKLRIQDVLKIEKLPPPMPMGSNSRLVNIQLAQGEM